MDNLPKHKEESSEDWLVSYADMLTLLLAFFVIMIAISTTNKSKYQQVANSMSTALVGTEEEVAAHISNQEKLQKNLNQFIEKEDLKLATQITEKGVSIILPGGIFFESGKAELQPSSLGVLEKLVEKFKGAPFEISIEGHTDNVPIKSGLYPSNWELSSARASQVVRFLIEKGIPAERLKAIGLADTTPVAPNMDNSNNPLPENQAKNRRVVILIHLAA